MSLVDKVCELLFSDYQICLLKLWLNAYRLATELVVVNNIFIKLSNVKLTFAKDS